MAARIYLSRGVPFVAHHHACLDDVGVTFGAAADGMRIARALSRGNASGNLPRLPARNENDDKVIM